MSCSPESISEEPGSYGHEIPGKVLNLEQQFSGPRKGWS